MGQVVRQQLLPHEQLPEFLQNEPTVADHLLFFYDAFWELDSERQLGMVAGPVPWSSIMLYANTLCLDEYQTDLLMYFIRAMDRVYLKFHADKNKKD